MSVKIADKDTSRVLAVLQAGGRGERLRPMTDTIPKAILEVGGIPIIERLLLQFRRAGIRSATVITGWLGDKLEERVRADHNRLAPLRIEFLQEDQPLGNFGAIAGLNVNRPVLMAFGDLVTDLDFQGLLKWHFSSNVDITLASHYEQHQVQYGELLVDGESVLTYQEKPLKRFLVCSGIAVFNPEAVGLMQAGEGIGFSSFVERAIAEGLRVSHRIHKAHWVDVNDAQALARANELFGSPLVLP